MWKDSIRNIVVIFQTTILRIVGFYVRHSAYMLCDMWSRNFLQNKLLAEWRNKKHFTKVNHSHKFSCFLLFRCVQPNLCNDNREKANINPFGSISHSSIGKEDVLNSLIKSAQNAVCPEKGAKCCSTKFISTKGKF